MQHAIARFSYAMLFGLALGAGAWSVPGIATAQSGASSSESPEARYQREVQRCKSGESQQDLKTCMREAGAALNEARHHRLMDKGSASYDSNATQRCNALPASEQQDCITQMTGGDTRVEGSVESGGILRETTITIPADSAGTSGGTTNSYGTMGTTPAPAPAPAPAPTTPGMRY